MFTGIVTAVGTVAKVSRNGGMGKGEGGLVLGIRAPYKGLKRGESVVVNGACLTVERVVRGGFTAHVVETTRDRTLFAEYARGRRVNLERAVRAADRLGGHLVQGHVDGVAEVVRVEERGGRGRRGGGGGGEGVGWGLRGAQGGGGGGGPQGAGTVGGGSLTGDALPRPHLG